MTVFMISKSCDENKNSAAAKAAALAVLADAMNRCETGDVRTPAVRAALDILELSTARA